MTRRVSLVTGAAGPTGSTIARVLAARGDRVAVNAHRGLERLDVLVAAIAAAGGEALAVAADVTDRAAAHAAVATVLDQWGRIDVLVNNAGAMRGAPFTEIDESDLEFTLATDLRSAFWCSQAAAAAMIGQGGGRIVMLSSLAASGSLGNANYAVAKAGVEGLTRTLALELGRHAITVNCVSPGLIASEKLAHMPDWLAANMVAPAPMRVAVEPVDVAHAVAFLSSDEARYISGQVLHVSGGLERVVRGMQEP